MTLSNNAVEVDAITAEYLKKIMNWGELELRLNPAPSS